MKLATRFGSNRRVLSSPSGSFLAMDDIARAIPSAFAQEAHDSRSARYVYVPTSDIIKALDKEGFKPTFAAQAIPRREDKHGFTKHMLRFRHVDSALSRGPRGGAFESVLVNSHDGTSSYQLFSGWIEFLCLNSCVSGSGFEEVRVPHKGDIIGKVIEGTYQVIGNPLALAESIDSMQALRLSPPERRIFAEAAAELRFDLEPGDRSPVNPDRFLTPRRYEERGRDSLWSTFQTVQENVIRGGLHGVSVNANGARRNMTTRNVEGIDQNVKLNRALWTLADKMAELKRAA
jgi:hypothetical protein